MYNAIMVNKDTVMIVPPAIGFASGVNPEEFIPYMVNVIHPIRYTILPMGQANICMKASQPSRENNTRVSAASCLFTRRTQSIPLISFFSL